MALNPNAEPFYYPPPKISSFISQPHLLYHGFPNTPFYYPYPIFRPTTQFHLSGANTHWQRFPVSTNNNILLCHHQKLPLGNGIKRVAHKYEWRVKGTTKDKEKKLLDQQQQKHYSAPIKIAIPFPTTIEEAQASNFTTLMIRNIPNQFKLHDLLQILDDHCLEQNKTVDDSAHYSKFDFVYLPMDYRRHAINNQFSNLGYAFVNFTTPLAAYKFCKEFHGFVWNVTKNKKTCQINKAQCQGKEALMNKFNHKVFRCESSEFLPVEFPEGRDGWNRKSGGITVGEHIWGLPKRSIGS